VSFFLRLPVIGSALFFALLAACSSDHSSLAKTASVSTAGAGGAAVTSVSTVTTTGTGGIMVTPEPKGPTKLTVVNGLVDGGAGRLCFVAYPPRAAEPAQPWPEAVGGLPFGGVVSTDAVDELMPKASDIEVILLTGAIGLSAGLSCADLVATPLPGLDVRTLAVLPKNIVDEKKSMLLVLAGCVGGEDHTSELDMAICGAGYAPDQPTVSIFAGFMSRIGALNKLPMQFVHASMGLGTASLRLSPGFDGAVGFHVANPWKVGGIAPFPPYEKFSVVELGTLDEAKLSVYGQGAAGPLSEDDFEAIFGASELALSSLSDGEGVAFIALGASPTVPPGGWYEPFRWVAVPSDP
jgi:hypothetical protein